MANQKKQPVYEEQAQTAGAPIGKVLAAIVCFGLAVLLVYLTVAQPQPNTFMGSIRDVIRGIGGSINLLLSVVFIWIGVLQVFSLRGKKIRILNVIMNSLLFLLFFTAVHLFSTRKILEIARLTDYFNFVSRSFREGIGGGFLGSLLAHPLYMSIGQWGGLIVVILLAIVCLTVTGRAQKIYRWTMNRAEEGQHHIQQRRNEREAERLFDYNSNDYDEYDNYAPRRPDRRIPQSQPQARPARRATNPDRDYMIIDTPAPAPRKNTKSSAAAAAASRKKLYKEVIDQDAAVEEKEIHGVDIPKPLREIRKTRPAGEEAAEAPAERPRRKRSTFPRDIPDFFKVEEDETPAEETPAKEKDEFIPTRYDQRKPKPKRVVEGVHPLAVDDIIHEPEPQEDDEAPFDIPHEIEKKSPRFSRKQENRIEENEEDYPYPPLDLLSRGSTLQGKKKTEDGDLYRASKLISTLKEFGVEAELVDEGIVHGPSVTCFKIMPGAGVHVERITRLEKNIALKLAAKSIRIEAPIPGESAVGIEIPNAVRETVHLRDVLEAAKRESSKLLIALGKDNNGEYIFADIAEMPHLLIGGQTGSGKSVCMNTIITSILYRATPDEVRMIMIDPKCVELSVYAGIPHLIAPVVTDPKKAVAALDWAVAEMMRRYKLFEKSQCSDIEEYNKYKNADEPALPKILIIIDELADLMMVAAGEVENDIQRLTQLARAAGMHLIVGTQRPEVKYVPGSIKANIPTRMAFQTAQYNDSKTILDFGGAEKLLGKGDMLYVPPGSGTAIRMQCSFANKKTEISKAVKYIKDRYQTMYDDSVVERIENSVLSDAEKADAKAPAESDIAKAIRIVIAAGEASTSMLQRRMRVGYAKAGFLIDQMELCGIISGHNGSKARELLITNLDEAMAALANCDEEQ